MIYAPGRPFYKVSSTVEPRGTSYNISLTIKQVQTHSIPNRTGGAELVYLMPLDVTITYADGTSETRIIQNNLRKQHFSFSVDKFPLSVQVDKDNWVLKKIKGQ
jgi:hypothetical protein